MVTVYSYIGIKFAAHKLYLNPNTTIAILDDQEISLKSAWNLTFGDVNIVNNINRRMYEVTVVSPATTITFLRKVYMLQGLEDQWHYDYHASLGSNFAEMHGYQEIPNKILIIRLLGQTWELKSFNKPAAWKYLDGYEDDYRVQSNKIFGDDFKFNRFQNI